MHDMGPLGLRNSIPQIAVSGRLNSVFLGIGTRFYVFFLPPLFGQRIPAFWTQNLG